MYGCTHEVISGAPQNLDSRLKAQGDRFTSGLILRRFAGFSLKINA